LSPQNLLLSPAGITRGISADDHLEVRHLSPGSKDDKPGSNDDFPGSKEDCPGSKDDKVT